MTTRVVTSTTLSSEEKMTVTKNQDSNGVNTMNHPKLLQSHSFLVCDDPKNHSPVVNPTAGGSATCDPKPSPTKKHQYQWKWPSRSTTPPWILDTIAIFDQIFVSWWLMELLGVWQNYIPLYVKRKITFVAWDWFVWIHTIVVCQWMGFYKDTSFYESYSVQKLGTSKEKPMDDSNACETAKNCILSDEYKALATLCYPSQFFVIDIPRMRFALSELNVVSLKDLPPKECIDKVEFHWSKETTDESASTIVPDSQQDHQTVGGLYISNPKMSSSSKKTRKILFWFFGGAYLAGDAEGNASLANEFMEDCEADAVFVPSYRLAPEATIDDVLWDVVLSYRYLLQRLQTEQQNDTTTSEIVFVGISSGGALALRLLQLLRDRSSKTPEPLMPSFLEPIIDETLAVTSEVSAKIAGAVLFGPYVDYRDPQPASGSFVQNAKYDLVVTEAVQHYGLPYLNRFIPPLGDDLKSSKNINSYNQHGRIQYSPISQDMHDLPPLCLIASEHEACYDMTMEIANKARMTGSTDVTIAVWKYMCHVFSMMQALVPEGKTSIDFTKEWIRSKTTNTLTNGN